ncbi:MAG: septum formation protein [Bradymonadia bacterium]|jgi:septum formation protein
MFPVLLASASPRRRQLLGQVGFHVTTRPVDVDEAPGVDEDPLALVTRLAETKAEAAIRTRSGSEPRVGIAADTIVWTTDGHVLGKPKDESDAVRMLTALSGRRHRVSTGFSIFDTAAGAIVSTQAVTTEVAFRDFTEARARAYVATGEPMDKAGAYGIQGMGAVLVRGIRGSYTNVVGLPIGEVVAGLQDAGMMTGYAWEAPDHV